MYHASWAELCFTKRKAELLRLQWIYWKTTGMFAYGQDLEVPLYK